MTRPTHLWFIRHGEVEAPYVGTFLGRTDVGLSDLGRHQAEAVARFLEDAPLDAVLTSPLQRARVSAVPLGRAAGMKAEVRTGLREMDFGAWEGRQWPDIEAADPDYARVWQADPAKNPCPEGESAHGFYGRVRGEIDNILQEFAGRNIALFAHAGTNRAVLAHVLERPYLEMFAFAQDYGCVNAAAFEATGGHGQVALLNFVPGPRSPANGDGGRRVPE